MTHHLNALGGRDVLGSGGGGSVLHHITGLLGVDLSDDKGILRKKETP